MLKDILTLKIKNKWIAMGLSLISITFILGLPHFYVKNIKAGLVTLVIAALGFLLLRNPMSEPFMPVLIAIYLSWQFTTILFYGTMGKDDFNARYNKNVKAQKKS